FVAREPTGEVDRYRALLEGVAFVERLGVEQLVALGFVPGAGFAVAGGGSRSRVWNRIRATVLGRTLTARAGADTARGACILAAAGTLHPTLTAATDAMAAPGAEVRPDDEEAPALERSYRRFLEALQAQPWYPEQQGA
ncbi:MAG: FGGY-family carbohydrate kinase, partial [Acidimicrobiales bacterium]